jgi:hypothetical protein
MIRSKITVEVTIDATDEYDYCQMFVETIDRLNELPCSREAERTGKWETMRLEEVRKEQ